MKKRLTPSVSPTAVKAANALLCIIALLVAAVLLNACKTQQATASIPRNDSTAIHRDYAHGNRIIHDSIYIREKGDTILLEHWHTEYRDSIRTIQDTVYKDKEVIIHEPPERYVTPWAWWSLGASILFVILFLLRIFIRIYFRR